MGRDEIFDEILDVLMKFGQCALYLEDEDEIAICPAEEFVGGTEGYYMCDVLGNVEYNNPNSIIRDVLNFIGDRKIDSIEVD